MFPPRVSWLQAQWPVSVCVVRTSLFHAFLIIMFKYASLHHNLMLHDIVVGDFIAVNAVWQPRTINEAHKLAC